MAYAERPAGLIFGEGTRTIVNAGERVVALEVANRTRETCLVRVSVHRSEGSVIGPETTDFVIRPKTFVLEPDEKRDALFYRRAGGQSDVESLYWASALFVPQKKAGQADALLHLAMRINRKIFVRPKALQNNRAVQEAAQALRVQRRRGRISLVNPTPYWFTLGAVTADGRNVIRAFAERMIAPKNTLVGPEGLGAASRVCVRFIDENGCLTPDQCWEAP